MDGIKTGYIQASGHNLVSSAHRDNKRMVGVIFGGHSAAERDAEMAQKLDTAFTLAAENDNNPHNSQGGSVPSPDHKKDRLAWAPPLRMP